MALLSKDELLKKEIHVQEEEVEIPVLGGAVKLRGIKDAREMDEIGLVLRRVALMHRTMPQYKKYTLDTMSNAVWVAACMVEPDMDFEETLEFGTREGMGPWLRILAGRVLQLSGLTEQILKEDEEALEQDTFPLSNALNLPRISESASEGSGPDTFGVDGDLPLQQDKKQTRTRRSS